MIEAERVNSAIPNDPLLNNPSRVFPVYDGHGNMVASLKRGSGSYTLANEKRYDTWGQVRYDDGVGTSDHVINPRNRFCGNLGHWDDDLLGLTYMRARWYEPTTGRFISEDTARDGQNWFVYCTSDPVGAFDISGNKESLTKTVVSFLFMLISSVIGGLLTGGMSGSVAFGITGWLVERLLSDRIVSAIDNMIGRLRSYISMLRSPAIQAAERSHAAAAIDASVQRTGQIYAELFLQEIDEMALMRLVDDGCPHF
jgi:RHS repeat-associated protein